jgi:hypothetical protein
VTACRNCGALDAEFYTSNKSKCKICVRAAVKQYAVKNPEVNARATKKWREKNPERMKAAVKAWDAAHPEKKLEAAKKRQKRYPHLAVAAVARRRAVKHQATPTWADKKAISQYYLIAGYLSSELGSPFSVDHVVPLKSESVCGLHAQTNLSILPAAWNAKKGNRIWPGKP